jgi:hypothetical protein
VHPVTTHSVSNLRHGRVIFSPWWPASLRVWNSRYGNMKTKFLRQVNLCLSFPCHSGYRAVFYWTKGPFLGLTLSPPCRYAARIEEGRQREDHQGQRGYVAAPLSDTGRIRKTRSLTAEDRVIGYLREVCGHMHLSDILIAFDPDESPVWRR